MMGWREMGRKAEEEYRIGTGIILLFLFSLSLFIITILSVPVSEAIHQTQQDCHGDTFLLAT
jgi:hypothetical protein